MQCHAHRCLPFRQGIIPSSGRGSGLRSHELVSSAPSRSTAEPRRAPC